MTRPTPPHPTISRTARVCCVLAVATLAACAPRVDTRGNQLHEEDIATIKTGESTRSTVLDRLGSPSNQSSFPPETWYYLSETTETTAFLEPELKSRQVLKIVFDESGVVSDIVTMDENAATEITPADGETPTAGNKMGLFDQLLSNMGRFNK